MVSSNIVLAHFTGVFNRRYQHTDQSLTLRSQSERVHLFDTTLALLMTNDGGLYTLVYKSRVLISFRFIGLFTHSEIVQDLEYLWEFFFTGEVCQVLREINAWLNFLEHPVPFIAGIVR